MQQQQQQQSGLSGGGGGGLLPVFGVCVASSDPGLHVAAAMPSSLRRGLHVVGGGRGHHRRAADTTHAVLYLCVVACARWAAGPSARPRRARRAPDSQSQVVWRSESGQSVA